jgi:glycosyltransferase involved in cell wall biosynthesis
VDLLSRQGDKNILCVHGSILHNDEITGFNGWIRKRLLIPILYRRADAIVPVSARLESELQELGLQSGKIRVINNFFDHHEIQVRSFEAMSPDEECYFDDGIPVILATARLHQHKNLAPLVDVVAQLAQRRPVRLLILGDGPMRDELVAHSRSSGAATYDHWSDSGNPRSTICFAGEKLNPFPFYRRATLFALPSNIEGFPLSLCEAMSCNLPVVASDCPGGVREIVDPARAPTSPSVTAATRAPFGLLMPMLSFDWHRRDLWVEALQQLIGNPGDMEVLSRAAARRVADFSSEKIIPEWRALFDQLLEKAAETQGPMDRSTTKSDS